MDVSTAKAEAEPPEDSIPRRDSGEEAPVSKEDEGTKKAPVKKRTKTGCMTCRKRRIKCDEGKPTCNNCMKSKRICEGYSQRVVFKEPISTFHGGPYGPVIYHPPPAESAVNAQMAAAAAAAVAAAQARSCQTQGPLPVIAPKPPTMGFAPVNANQFSGPYPSPSRPPGVGFHQELYPTQQEIMDPRYQASTQLHPQRLPSPPYVPVDQQIQLQRPDIPYPNQLPPGAPGGRFDGAPGVPLHPSSFVPVSVEDLDFLPPDSGANAAAQTVTEFNPEEHYWYDDDEASMEDSDDDDPIDIESDATNLKKNHLGAMVARRIERVDTDIYGTHIRAPSSYLGDQSILTTYYPSSTTSPLTDAQAAAVFWHFVNVTAPSMSLYERHPLDPSPMFQGRPVPKARQHIWTYTFPILALNHPALLQGMLALGSLQMAMLESSPATASMKHYHLSLRRIARNYRNPGKRAAPATLAATLLLGFYEVWNSDHEKWCKHLWGARALLKEIPLRAMTKAVRATKRKRRPAPDYTDDGFHAFYEDYGNRGVAADPDDVDTNLLAQLTGRPVDYEVYGRMAHASDRVWSQKILTEKDIENYEQTVDLFWWYCKMDVYQSILGGTLLLMDFDLWTQVAPRSMIGRIDAVYGTFDHVILLLGRLTNFASRDLARKRKAAKGGPPGGKPGGGGPSAMPGGPAGGPPGGQSPPPFAGMMPTTGTFSIPTGFSPPADAATPTDGLAEDVDLEESTKDALAEWESIRQAFNTFAEVLGPDFAPLGYDFAAPQPSPFGPALLYRTYSIAGIWLNYYMGLILLYRAHPSMPPIAMVAAGMAAQQTAPYANTIGRIAAGLLDDADNVSEVPTVVGAAFIESCFPLFVAGVQLQDNAQRVWTIQRLFDVARLTGWQSARPIAGGCESAWTKAASLKRGPPYERPEFLQQQDPNVWNRPRRIDTRIKELDDEFREREGVEDNKRMVVLAQSEQTHYALGLIAMEQDVARLDLSSEK